MADIYVSKSGNDGDTGADWTHSLLTISQAITNASAGDTIWVGPGDYAETADIDASNKQNITINGIDKTAWIKHANNNAGVKVEAGTTLSNLSIQVTDEVAPCASARGVAAFSGALITGVTLDNCYVEGAFDGTSLQLTDSVVIKNSYIYGYYDAANQSNSADGTFKNSTFYADGSHDIDYDSRGLIVSTNAGDTSSGTFTKCTLKVVRDNTVTAKEAVGANIKGDGTNNFTFDKCTVLVKSGTGHSGEPYGVWSGAAGTTITLRKCVIKVVTTGSGTPYSVVRAAGTVNTTHCCGYPSTSGTIVGNSNKWNLNPVFVSDDDLHLKSSSPCLGLGRYEEFPLGRSRYNSFAECATLPARGRYCFR